MRCKKKKKRNVNSFVVVVVGGGEYLPTPLHIDVTQDWVLYVCV